MCGLYSELSEQILEKFWTQIQTPWKSFKCASLSPFIQESDHIGISSVTGLFQEIWKDHYIIFVTVTQDSTQIVL